MANVESEETKILQFQEICGISDEETSRRYLARFAWDLELAVQEFLNAHEEIASFTSDEDLPGVESDQRPQDLAGPSNLRFRGSGNVVASGVPQEALRGAIVSQHGQRSTWLEWGRTLVLVACRFVTTSVSDLVRFVCCVLAEQINHYSIFLDRMFFPAFRQVTDPMADVANFIERFEEKFGALHPPFYRGSYSAALNEAKRDLKFLLVYLHSESHQDTDRFCRKEGHCSADEIIAFLTVALQDNENYLAAARQQREQHQFNQQLRQQQEEAFQESLRADRQREAARQAEHRKQAEAVEQSRRIDEEGRMLQEEVSALKSCLKRTLPDEPAPADDVIRVSLKFASGARVERRFLSTDTVENLHNFTFCQDECPRSFSLVTNFPRKVLFSSSRGVLEENATGLQSLAEVGLEKAVLLLVLDNDA